MTETLSHLNPAALELLRETNDRRIQAILAERWVQYSRAGQVLGVLNLLLEHPRTTRMPSIAVYGDSGMGKPMIMQRFRDLHRPAFDAHAGVERTRVLALQLAGKPGVALHLTGSASFYVELFYLTKTASWRCCRR